MTNDPSTSAFGIADSDSVNLGSNPGAPATTKAAEIKDISPSRTSRTGRPNRHRTGTEAAQKPAQSAPESPDFPALPGPAPCRAHVASQDVPAQKPAQQNALNSRLAAAISEVLEASDELREGMGPEWEGDPLTDACDELRAAFEAAQREAPPG